MDIIDPLNVLQPVIDQVRSSLRVSTSAAAPEMEVNEEGAASEALAVPSSDMLKKFSALRSKFGASLAKTSGSYQGKASGGGKGSGKRKGGKGKGGVRALDVIDPLLDVKETSSAYMYVVKLSEQEEIHNYSQSTLSKLKLKLQTKSKSAPLAVCVLGRHSLIEKNKEWSQFLGKELPSSTTPSFFYIILPTLTPDLVWYCGWFQTSSLMSRCMRAVINSAVDSKKKGDMFAKLAKDWARLGELASSGEGGGGSRMEHLFPKVSLSVREQIQMDATASFSVTDEVTADQITDKCAQLLVNDPLDAITIVDGTACVGGNTLSFMKQFRHVIGVEIDPSRFDMLQSNVKLLQSNGGKAMKRCHVELYCDNFLTMLDSGCRKQSCLSAGNGSKLFFLDPPWGGLVYKDQDEVKLELGGVAIQQVMHQCLNIQGCRHVVLKCPFNTDVTGIRAVVDNGSGGLKMTLWSLSKKVKCVVVSKVHQPTNQQQHEEDQKQENAGDAKKKKKKKHKKARVEARVE